MFYTYIIQGSNSNKYYIGSCKDINDRIKRHNSGSTKSLKNKGPFKLIYKEDYATREEAYRRERKIKSYKGGNAFKELIQMIVRRDTEVAKRDRL